MKNSYKTISKQLVLTLLLFSSLTGWASNQNLVIGDSQEQANKVALLSDKSDIISLKFNLNQITLNEVVTHYGSAYTVLSNKAPNTFEKGSPELIYLTGTVIIPETGNMKMEVIPGDFVEYFDIDIAPSKGILTRDIDPATVPYEKGRVYGCNEFYPGNFASLREPYILRDFRGQTVEVYPVQYNPVTKILRVYKEIKVNIYKAEGKGVNELIDQRKNKNVYSEFDNIYRRNFLNYTTRQKYTPIPEDGLLLIVSHANYIDAVKPLVDWKNQKGQPVKLVSYTQAGGTSAALKTYITTQYNSAEGLVFVLLIGDSQHIPPMNKSGDSDPAYGHIIGTDSYAEAFIGRFSAESVADVQTQVARSITYERDLTTTDTWLKNGMGIASSEGGGSQGDNGESDIQHMNIIRNKLLNFNYTTVYQVYDPGASASTVVTNLNNGVGITNYVGHGSDYTWVTTGFGVSNMSSLTNVNKLPFIFDVACVNGNFVNKTCFAEAFVRAKTSNGPTGTLAIMASTINQSWNSPMRGQDEMNDILVESYTNNIKRTYGGIGVNGCMNMNDVYSTDGYNMTNTWTIFGDPSVVVRTNTPSQMILSHNPTLFLGSSSYSVSCDVEGAIVALSYVNDEENVVLLGKAVTASGTATVTFDEPITTPIDITITVTAYNKVTYISSVSAVPADEPYVILKSFVTNINPDFGQTVELNVVLENISEDPYTASEVTASISTASEVASIIGSSVAAGTIVPGQQIQLDGAFSFSITDNVSNQTPIPFTITITGEYDGESYEWSQNFTIKANAPVLSIGNLTINDGGQGVPNYLEPGEEAQIVLTLSNTGNAAANGAVVSISAASPFFNIIEGQVMVDVAAESEVQVSFEVEANASTPNGLALDVSYSAQLGAYQAQDVTPIFIGPLPESTIGTGNEDQQSYAYYPLDNYYKAGKSQMLYTKNEVSLTPQTITHLGLDIKSIGSINPYVNLTIKLMETPLNEVPTSYVATTNATTVFNAASYTMPSTTGWLIFDINDFQYSGQNNLLVEITFGINANWSSTRYNVRCTSTTLNTVTYGYSDTQAIPSYSGRTNKRPNLHLSFAAEYEDFYPVSVLVKDVYQNPLPNAVVTFGSLPLVTDNQGTLTIELPEGIYPWMASKDDYLPATGNYTVEEGGGDLVITLLPNLNTEAEILTFNFEEDVLVDVVISPVVDNLGTIDVTVAMGTDISSLTPTITISYGATMYPDGGITMDFTNPVTFAVTSQDGITVNVYTVYVVEEPEQFILSLVANPEEGGTVEGAGSYIEGASVTVTAVANEWFNFVNWTDENEIEVSTDASFIYSMPAQPMTLTANFVAIPHYLVTLNVDMANAENFNPETDIVYVTGSMLGWATPGDDPENQTMTRVEGTMIWTITYDIEAGTYEYKYFLNNGWDNGEWAGGDNRVVVVESEVVKNDIWGIPDAAESNILSNINVYPNPFSSQIIIDNPSIVKRIIVTNILGQVVINSAVKGNGTISTDGLENGIYLVTIEAINGDRIVRKMIKR
jgi:hypothetical protein